jgi:hypothetical protein
MAGDDFVTTMEALKHLKKKAPTLYARSLLPYRSPVCYPVH